MTIKEILFNASKKLKKANIRSASLDAEILLSFVLKKSKEWLIANSEKEISGEDFIKFQKLITRRLKFEPIAYIISKKEFYGLDWNVNKSVLIPRPETEILVEEVLKEIESRISNRESGIKIIDIGTGCGNIAISLSKFLKIKNCELKIYASDILDKALKVAKQNAKIHKVQNKIKFVKSNLFQKFPKNIKFDIIVANLPYLDQKIMKQNPELKYEPYQALYGGKNGLQVYNKFFKQVKNHLKKNSKILIEIDPIQSQKINKIILSELPKSKIKFIRDLNNFKRVLIIASC